jgi:hypothetical protein
MNTKSSKDPKAEQAQPLENVPADIDSRADSGYSSYTAASKSSAETRSNDPVLKSELSVKEPRQIDSYTPPKPKSRRLPHLPRRVTSNTAHPDKISSGTPSATDPPSLKGFTIGRGLHFDPDPDYLEYLDDPSHINNPFNLSSSLPKRPSSRKYSGSFRSSEHAAVDNMPEPSILEELSPFTRAGADWTHVQENLPELWKWDLEFNSGCWTCTPMELDMPKHYPLKIAQAPVVLPVEHQWPPMGGVNPPPDPRRSNPIDCRAEMPLDVVRDLFLTFEGSVGFYLLINGLLQVIVTEDFNMSWASYHLPHKYGGLKICYILPNIESTMLPTIPETARTQSTRGSQRSGITNIFRHHSPVTVSSGRALKHNDFIEARSKTSHWSERYAGRIGLKIAKSEVPYLIMSTHVIVDAILAKPYRNTFFPRSVVRLTSWGVTGMNLWRYVPATRSLVKSAGASTMRLRSTPMAIVMT